MILLLWLSLLFLSFGICILGYYTDDEPYLTIGLFFMFLLGLAIVTGQLQYETGNTTNTTFTYNGTSLTTQQDTSTITYTTWNDTTSHIVGYFLAALGAVGLALSLRNIRHRGMNDEE